MSEDRFKSDFLQFTRLKGIRLNERDLVIDGRRIDLWALHRAVRAGNGFESVSAHDEWPVIGVALGFPLAAGGNAGQPPRCGCIIAHRLQLLYNDLLRDFDQVYLDLNSPAARSRSSDQLPVLQSTEADHQTLFLASITSEPSAHHVPRHIISFVEQNREHLHRAAEDRYGSVLVSHPPRTRYSINRIQVDHASALQAMALPQQLIPGHLQLQASQPPGLVQGPGKRCSRVSFHNVGPLVPPSMAQSITEFSIP
ncbi:hypothetical protein BJV77DRAFT_1066100 [Russula vinacea]|nr:hypothetical protein BJV77DRAFT_1066100 [Russula vinacea]